MSDRSRKADLKVPSRHLYDSDEPEPTFEPPTPLRYNRSVPGNIGQWKKEKYSANVSISTKIDPSVFNMEIESNAGSTVNPYSNPLFYPALRYHRRSSQSESEITNVAPSVGSQTNREAGARFNVFSTPGKSALFNDLSLEKLESDQRNTGAPGITIVAPPKDYFAFDEQIAHSLPSSAQPPPRRSLSPRLLSDLLPSTLGGILKSASSKKVEMSNFDISVIAPPSF